MTAAMTPEKPLLSISDYLASLVARAETAEALVPNWQPTTIDALCEMADTVGFADTILVAVRFDHRPPKVWDMSVEDLWDQRLSESANAVEFGTVYAYATECPPPPVPS